MASFPEQLQQLIEAMGGAQSSMQSDSGTESEVQARLVSSKDIVKFVGQNTNKLQALLLHLLSAKKGIYWRDFMAVLTTQRERDNWLPVGDPMTVDALLYLRHFEAVGAKFLNYEGKEWWTEDTAKSLVQQHDAPYICALFIVLLFFRRLNKLCTKGLSFEVLSHHYQFCHHMDAFFESVGQCKLPDNVPTPRLLSAPQNMCTMCKNQFAMYGVDSRTHCGQCKTADMKLHMTKPA